MRCYIVIILHAFQLEVLNLGNNLFEEFPLVIAHMISLVKLHLYGNLLSGINGAIFGEFSCLMVLFLMVK